jgi:hypothetical protein
MPGTCVVDPDQVGDACGTSGQICQSDGTCVCSETSCPACTTCGGDGQCKPCTDCCDGDGVCRDGDTNIACGSSGTCDVCTGQEQCQSQTCVCVPACAGRNCGPDGCNGSCGTCTGFQTCEGGGTPGVCGCTPTTCTAQDKNCGTISDGCGGPLNCGSCAFPGEPCTDNVCGTCVPTSCAGKACGASDDCGGTCSACSPTCPTGSCPSGESCRAGTCAVTGRTYECTCGNGTTRSTCGTVMCQSGTILDICTAQCVNSGGYGGGACLGDTCFV